MIVFYETPVVLRRRVVDRRVTRRSPEPLAPVAVAEGDQCQKRGFAMADLSRTVRACYPTRSVAKAWAVVRVPSPEPQLLSQLGSRGVFTDHSHTSFVVPCCLSFFTRTFLDSPELFVCTRPPHLRVGSRLWKNTETALSCLLRLVKPVVLPTWLRRAVVP